MLYVIANAADPEGIAFTWWNHDNHWWPYLVRRTGLKRASVFRVLNEMEEAQLLARDLISPKTPGRPQPVIRLNFERVYNAEIENPESYGETETQSHGETQPAGPSPTMGPAQSHGETGHSIDNPKDNPLPPSPPSGGIEAQAAIDDEKERFDQLCDAYPRPTNRATLAFARWRQMTEDDRAKLERAVRGASLVARANPKTAILDLEKFMRDPLSWDTYARRLPPPPPAPPPQRFLPVNSDELRALAVIVRIAGSQWIAPAYSEEHGEAGKIVSLPELPAVALGAARYANGLGEIDDANWIMLNGERENRQMAAWREAIQNWIGASFGTKRTLRVPCEWPSMLKTREPV
jgi:hypothetical protein